MSSNRDDLIRDLRSVIAAYRNRPSSLLAELERFMIVNGLNPNPPARLRTDHPDGNYRR